MGEIGERIRETLVAQAPGTLVVIATPYGDVFVDGVKTTERRDLYRGEHPVGVHTIRVEHPSYGFVERSVEITSGEETRLTIDMQKEGQRP